MNEEMDLVEKVNRERRATPWVDREVKGLGMVRIRRLETGDVLAFPEDSHFNVQMVLASAMKKMGEGEGTSEPRFASVREVEKLDWGVFKALAAECSAVNSLDLEAAKKG
jgi:hypothetical protein